MSKCRKITFSVPPSFVDDLDYLAERLGVTRSALLVNITMAPLHDLRDMVSSVPANPTKSDILRAKGRSKELIDDRIQSVRDLGNDLFSE